MGALTALFGFRVAAQLIQHLHPVSWLPSFADWHSGAIPYALLLAAQLAILAFAIHWTAAVATGRIVASAAKARAVLGLTAVYVAFMIGRLLLGGTLLAGDAWWDRPLPTFFHFVLASKLLLIGCFHLHGAAGGGQVRDLIGRIAYPGTLLIGFSIFALAGQLDWDAKLTAATGLPLPWAAYVSIFVAVGLIFACETANPYRPTWKPGFGEAAADFGFLALVQVLLPQALALALIWFLVSTAGEAAIWKDYWPHGWWIGAQALLMLMVADFFRYWLHRAAHEWRWLWRIHAVHHSSERLYFLNVGRFHPVDKALQFLFDAAPFILLGVAQEVLAVYFVFYAINGFYQHSNCAVRLGPLNLVIAGPELHRWHHSRLPSESNNNYGNNVIVWDRLFGTCLLPKDRDVGPIGLLDSGYPQRFLKLIAAPLFRSGSARP